MDVSELKVLARRANGMLFVLPVFILLSGFGLVYSILVLTGAIEPDKEILLCIYMFSVFRSRRRVTRHFNMLWDEKFNPVLYPEFEENFIDSNGIPTLDVVIDKINSYEFLVAGCVISSAIWFLVCTLPFFERLFTPSVMIEYDDYGLYIYKYNQPPVLLKYKEIWSTLPLEDFDNIEITYHRGLFYQRTINVGNLFWGVFKTGSIRIETPDGFIKLNGVYHVKDVEHELKKIVRQKRKEYERSGQGDKDDFRMK